MNLRAALSISPKTDILDHIYSLPQPQQSHAQASIRAIESEAMLSQEPQPGLLELISYLETGRVRMGLCTRNFELALPFHRLILDRKGKGEGRY